MAVYLVPLDKGRPIVLDKAVVFIGRHPECDVILKASRKVSRKHCCLAQVESRIVIRDLGSMNGIRLNGNRVKKEATVKLGDEITIGDVTYVLKARGRMDEESGSVALPPLGEPGLAKVQDFTPPRPGSASAGNSSDDSNAHVPQGYSPLGLSQDFPIPIPEESGEEFDQKRLGSRPPRASKPPSAPPARGDEDEDVVILDGSDEF